MKGKMIWIKYWASWSSNSSYCREPYEYSNKATAIRDIKSMARGNKTSKTGIVSWQVYDSLLDEHYLDEHTIASGCY